MECSAFIHPEPGNPVIEVESVGGHYTTCLLAAPFNDRSVEYANGDLVFPSAGIVPSYSK